MLTICTHVLKQGTFDEKLWDFLDKVYHPYNADWMKRLDEEIKELNSKAYYHHSHYLFSDTISLNTKNFGTDLMSEMDDNDNMPPEIHYEIDADKVQHKNYFYIDNYGQKQYLVKQNVFYPVKYIYKDIKSKVLKQRYDIYIPEHGFYDLRENDIAKIKKKSDYNIVKINVILDDNALKQYRKKKRLYKAVVKSGNLLYKIFHTVDSCILCLRFPFLYTRNRFTGTHYTNWKIKDYSMKLRQQCMLIYGISIPDDKSSLYEIQDFEKAKQIQSRPAKRNNREKCWFFIDSDNTEHVVKDKSTGYYHIFRYQGKIYFWNEKFGWIDTDIDKQKVNIFDILRKKKPFQFEKTKVFKYEDDTEERKYYWLCYDFWKMLKVKAADFLNDYILNVIFFLPTINELDAMPEGWRRKFGIQMCKDIRKQLIKDKFLFSFRIMQIKEKYGELRFYSSRSSKELDNIIMRYEDQSSKVCIECGKPAKYETSGYISYLCEDCIGDDKDNATLIEDLDKE